MSSYRQHLYHLVFGTKYKNGIENHLHIFTDMHPSIASADFLRVIKASSSFWMNFFLDSPDGRKDMDHLPALTGM